MRSKQSHQPVDEFSSRTPGNDPIGVLRGLRAVREWAPWVILFLYFYSNLVDRIYPIGTSAAFYFFIILAAICLLTSRNNKRSHVIVVLAVAAYFLLNPLLKSEGPLAAVAAVQDVSIPIVALLLGYASRSDPGALEKINFLYFPFVSYGVLQVALFHLGQFSTVLPWDARYVEAMRAAGLSVNQSELLRFFGTLNSFFHYQLIMVVVPVFLWVFRKSVRHRRLLIANTILAVAAVVMFQERMPIVVLGLISLVFAILGQGRLRIAGFLGFAGVIILALLISNFGDKENESDPGLRMSNAVTINVERDTSMTTRTKIAREMLNLVDADNIFFGMESRRLLPAYEKWSENGLISPHNLYLFLLLAFGLAGVALMVALGVWIALTFIRPQPRPEVKLLLIALSLAYLFLGMFHLSLVSKAGILFFFVIGFSKSGGYLNLSPGRGD